MEIPDFMNSLPVYLLFTLFLSYLLWLRFFKQGNDLKIETKEGLVEIFTIFLFILGNLVGVSFFILLLGQLAGWYLDLNSIWDTIKIFVEIFDVVIIFWLISLWKDESVHKENLKKIFIHAIFVFSLFVTTGLLMVLLTLFSDFSSLLHDARIWILLLSPILVIRVCYETLTILFGEINLFEEFFGKNEIKIKRTVCSMMHNMRSRIKGSINKKWLKVKRVKLIRILEENIGSTMLIIIILLVFFISKSMIPYPVDGDPVQKSYVIQKLDETHRVTYLKQQIPIHVPNLDRVRFNPISFIPIPYSKYNFDTETRANDFVLSINNTRTNQTEIFLTGIEAMREYDKNEKKRYNFTGLQLDTDNKILILKFDRIHIGGEGIGEILLEGFTPVKINDANYSYHDDFAGRGDCRNQGCTLHINISNELDAPVRWETPGEYKRVYLTNSSKCKFGRFSYWYENESTSSGCEHTYCIIKKDEVFEIMAEIDERANAVIFDKIDFLKAGKVSDLTINVICQD